MCIFHTKRLKNLQFFKNAEKIMYSKIKKNVEK